MRMLNLLREIVRSPVLQVLMELRQSNGMSVNELCAKMGMSYMGVKQHCIEMEKRHLVDTWRRPKLTGRPEKIYRLTVRAMPLFPQAGNALTVDLLDRANQVFGETAAQKLLFSHFQDLEQRWLLRMGSAPLAERMKLLQKLRLDEGYLSTWERDEAGWRWIDHHHPYAEVAAAFPVVLDLDRDCLESVLKMAVVQTLEEVGQLQRVIYRLSAPAGETISDSPA